MILLAHRFRAALLSSTLAATLQGCATTIEDRQAALSPDTEQSIAFTNVDVLTMRADRQVLQDTTLVVQGSRIISIGVSPPANALIVAADGKFMIPGLFDMHVHVPTDVYFREKRFPTEGPTYKFDTQDGMTPYVANGVTTIFNLSATPASIGQTYEIARGDVLGPKMALAVLIDGGGGSGWKANSPDDGRQTARIAAAEGYEFLKPYSALEIETYEALVGEAHRIGMKTVGHIPDAFDGDLDRALGSLDLVAHAEEFSKHAKALTRAEAMRIAKLAKEKGVWVTPTLIAMESIAQQARSLENLEALPDLNYIHPILRDKWINANGYAGASETAAQRFDDFVAFHRHLVRAFAEAGVPILAGTDVLLSGVVPGFSLHRELSLLVDAGLTPEEALDSATRLPAIWLGVDEDRGTIETGKRADLILLNADPRINIRHTREIEGVMLDGRWLPRPELNEMLEDLSGRNLQAQSGARWSERRKP